MDKFCIFCGEKPSEKSNEHVIPLWLIKKTGDPNRKVFLGFNLASDYKSNPVRNYSFDSFVFPACDSCNNEFSGLEFKAEDVVSRLLLEDKLSANDFFVLLDWLDKIRIGLWLGFFYLNKNSEDIDPHFHIKSRLRRYDRCVYIYKHNLKKNGINFAGADVISFQHNPVCFYVRINNYVFLNISHLRLCSRRLGFPYVRDVVLVDDKKDVLGVNYDDGFQRVIRPVIKDNFFGYCSKIFQPLFSRYIEVGGDISRYDNDYVRERCIDWQNGVGSIFFDNNMSVEVYPDIEDFCWLPDHVHNYKDLALKLGSQVLDYQVKEFCSYSLENLPHDRRRHIKQTITNMREMNAIYKEFVEKQVEKAF